MVIKLGLNLLLATAALGQVDDFNCPDEHIGFYPHLYSCDKYWYCQQGQAEERTCGNGLGFIDTDPTYTLEQCAELHLVECGERTELEPPISSTNCPRAWGTYADEEDCGVFWVCQDGKANRYECPPGLAYDQQSRGCRWADQVPECSNAIVIDEEGGEFQCPTKSQPGIFTKHAHPEDCRQYYLCIGGVPREYGCPLGTVFNVGSGNGVDGECSDPEQVPECRDYYGDQDFDPRTLANQGFDTGSRFSDVEERPRSSNTHLTRNSIPRKSGSSNKRPEAVTEVRSRPAPASLQEVVDRPSVGRGQRLREPATEQPLRFSEPVPVTREQQPLRFSEPVPVAREQPSRFIEAQEPDRLSEPEPSQPAILPARLTPIRIQPQQAQPQPTNPPQTERPSRFELLSNKRPNFRSPFRQAQTTSTTTTNAPAPARSRPFGRNNTPGRLSFSPNRFRPTAAPPTTTPTTTTTRSTARPVPAGGLPAPVPAKPGPDGEEYYYYYYYDDEEV